MNKKEKAIIADVKTGAKLASELATHYKTIAAKLRDLDGREWAEKGEVLSDAQKLRNFAATYIKRSAAIAETAALLIERSAALVAQTATLLKEREAFAKENGVTL